MSKTGLNIYRRRDGRWEGRYIKGYNELGKARYGYIYGKSYNETKKLLLNEQLDIYSANRYTGSITFSELSQKWLNAIRIKVKTSTYSRYINLLEQHILHELGECRLNKISNITIDNFVYEKLKSGRLNGEGGLSSKTVRDMLSVINSIVKFGETEKLIQKDGINITYPKNNYKEMKVLTRDEQKKFEKYLSADYDINKLGVLICLYTGIRIGEVCALRWEDILLTEEMILIRRTIQRVKNTELSQDNKTKIIIDKPKTRCSVRDIPIPGFLISKIKRYYCDNGKAYFLTGSEDRFIEPRTYQNYYKLYIKESQIDNMNFHGLRHTFATRCIELGFDIKSLSEILGHANVNITLNRYVHSSFELKQENMKKLCGVSPY